jgi:histidine triad (HIT) family protein
VTATDCLFCKIVAREISADVVAETDDALAFRDIAPQAPVHVLVVPKRHVESLGAAADDDVELLGELLLLARDVARREGVDASGFRAVTNTGDEGGQDVRHLHVHVLGGRKLEWPPG